MNITHTLNTMYLNNAQVVSITKKVQDNYNNIDIELKNLINIVRNK